MKVCNATYHESLETPSESYHLHSIGPEMDRILTKLLHLYLLRVGLRTVDQFLQPYWKTCRGLVQPTSNDLHVPTALFG